MFDRLTEITADELKDFSLEDVRQILLSGSCSSLHQKRKMLMVIFSLIIAAKYGHNIHYTATYYYPNDPQL